jgi:hypothetical protein
MPTLKVCPGLYLWTLTLADGTVRYMTASSADAAISGIWSSPVVKAERGGPVDGLAPAPVLTTLTPPSAKIGDPNFTLHVAGTGFRSGDVILWNGSPENTTFVSPTELTTGVNMATAQVAMPIPVAVRTVTGLDSNILTFTLQPAP